MWLTVTAQADFKTIADFRKETVEPFDKVRREFIVGAGRGAAHRRHGCHRWQQVQGGELRDRNFTQTKVAKRLEQIEASIERYLSELETVIHQPSTLRESRSPASRAKLPS